MIPQAPRIDYYRYVEDILRPLDIHEVRASIDRASGIAAALAISLFLTILHALLIYVLVNNLMSAAIPIFIHVVVSAILLVWSIGQYRSGADSPFITLIAVTTTFTGIFGALGSFIAVLMYGLFRAKATSFKDWFELIFPADIFSKSEETYNEILVGIDENPRDYDVIPFLDIMELGSEVQKRRALSKMMVSFNPSLAPAVQRGLRDASNGIRVQAATCVAKIEKQFMAKLSLIEQARKKDPSNLYILFALAKFYDDYAYTGLLDREREVLNRDKAIETYKEYLEQDPNHSDAWLAIGRLLFRSDKWKEASDWFANAIGRGWNMRPMLIWYLECLYRMGDYTTLRNVAKDNAARLKDDTDMPQNLRDCLALWAQH